MKKGAKPVLSRENAAQIAEAVAAWVVTPEGQREIAEGLREAQEMAAQFREAQRVDPQLLRKPVTR